MNGVGARFHCINHYHVMFDFFLFFLSLSLSVSLSVSLSELLIKTYRFKGTQKTPAEERVVHKT